MRRFAVLLSALTVATVAIAGPAAVPVAGAGVYPETVPLPVNFYPEGIAVGNGHGFYVGSLLDGAIYKGDLRTGEGAVLAGGSPGRAVAGLSFDTRSGLLWGVGFSAGAGAVFGFDSDTGELVHELALAGAQFPNDVVVARDALYVTDSLAAVLWRVPLTKRGTPDGPAVAIPLSGDFEFVGEADPLPINLNGIDVTSNGKTLVAVHSTLGLLYRIDPATGQATEIDLGADTVPFGDGIVLHGKTVYVVQNFLNQVAVVSLSADLAEGEITDTITSGLFDVPTTAALFGNSLYLVNARFDDAFPPFLGGTGTANLDYDVVRVRRD